MSLQCSNAHLQAGLKYKRLQHSVTASNCGYDDCSTAATAGRSYRSCSNNSRYQVAPNRRVTCYVAVAVHMRTGRAIECMLEQRSSEYQYLGVPVILAFGNPGTREYSVILAFGTPGTVEYSVISARGIPATR